MPQIPRYIVESGIPSDTGQRYISSGQIPSALPAVAQSSQQIAQSAVQSAGYVRAYNQANDTLTREQMKLDVDDKFNQVKVLVGAEALRLQEQGIHPDTYPASMDTVLRNSLQWAEKNLLYPESKSAFQMKALPYAHEQRLKSRQDALGIKYAQIGTMAEVQQKEDINAIVFAPTPQLAQQGMDRAVSRISDLVSSQVWSQQKGASMYDALLTGVEEGQAKLNLFDPVTRVDTVRRLLSGTDFPHMAPAQKVDLAERTIDRIRTEQDSVAKKAEAEWKVMGGEAYKNAIFQAEDGALTVQQAREIVQYWQRSPEDYERLHKIITQSPEQKELPTDPETRRLVLRGVWVSNPTMNENDLHRLNELHIATKGVRGLGSKDYKEALTRLTSTMEARDNEELRFAMKRIDLGLGIPDILPPGFDEERLRARDAAYEELLNRARGVPGKRGNESALDVVNKRVPEWQKALGDRVIMKEAEVRHSVTYQSREHLWQAWQNRGRVPFPGGEAEFRRQQRLWDNLMPPQQMSTGEAVRERKPEPGQPARPGTPAQQPQQPQGGGGVGETLMRWLRPPQRPQVK